MARIKSVDMTGRLWKAVSETEKRLVKQAIASPRETREESALWLGVSLPFLRARIKRYGLE